MLTACRIATPVSAAALGVALLVAWAATPGAPAATLVHTTADDFLAGQTDGGARVADGLGGELESAWWGRLTQAGYVAGPDLPAGRTGVACVSSRGHVFAIGGSTASPTAEVYTAAVAGDGSVGSWVATTSLPTPLAYHAAAVANGYVFVSGGTNGASVQSAAYSAAVHADGTLGSWSATSSLPAALKGHALIAADGYLLALGGETGAGGYSTEIRAAVVRADGSLGAWTLVGSLPQGLAYQSATVSGTYVYLVGGANTGGVQQAVYSAPLDGAGGIGSWTALTSLPAPRCGHAAVAAAGHLLISGGTDGSAERSTIYTAALDRTGVLGPWMAAPADTDDLPEPMAYHGAALCRDAVIIMGGPAGHVYSAPALRNSVGAVLSSASLPAALSYAAAVANDTHVFILGGWNGVAATSAVYSAPIAGDGSLGPWSVAGALPTTLYGTCAVLANGEIIIAGGNNGAAETSAVNHAPVNPDGSIGSWATTTSLPAALSRGAAVAIGSRIYVSGGYNGFQPTWETYSASIGPGGLGAWTAINSMPIRVYLHAMAAANGYLYVSGGHAGRGGLRDEVYAAQLNGDGTIGAWTAMTDLPGHIYGHASLTSEEHVFVAGGYADSAHTSAILSAPITSAPTLGAWSAVSALPQAAMGAAVAVGRGYLIAAGGEDAVGPLQASATAPKPGPMQIGRFTGRFALGPSITVNSLSWTGTGATLRCRTAPFDTKTYDAWSGYYSSGPVGLGGQVGFVEYEVLFDNWAGSAQQVQEVSLDYEATAPTIASPADGSVTNNPTCEVSGTATPGHTVEVYRNGSLAGTGQAPSGTFNISITLVDGSNEIKAKSYYGAIETPWSNIVSVTLDQEPPSCAVTSPSEGARVGGTVVVTADATDNVAVDRVEFYLDAELKSTDSASPYEWTWDTTLNSDGPHAIQAVAFDTAANSQADTKNVTVDNDPPEVESVDPQNGAVDVPVDANITATFDEEMDPGTISASTFLLEDADGDPVSGTVTYDAPTRTASFDPDGNLSSETHTATLVGGVAGAADLVGNRLASDYQWSFTAGQPPPPIVSGTVTEQGGGSPLEGASVSVFDSGGQWRNKDTTDVNGDYLIDTNLPEGSARVKCELAGYVTQNKWVTLTAGVTTDVDFQLEPVPAQSPIVSGTVTEQGSGTPLQGASVSVFDSGGQWRKSDTTDANGDYLIDANLPEGSARVKCELAGYVTQNKWVTLTAGVTTDVDFQLEPVPAQSPIVSGTVTEQGSGTPLEGASVSVFDSGGQWRNKDLSDANGDYLMDANLPEGSARVKCELAGYVTQSKWVTLTAGVTTDVDFQLEPVPAQSPIVSGTVTEQGSGTPLEGASVSVFDSGGQWRNKDLSDANGDYLMDANLPEGSARVKCELAGYVTQSKWVTLTAGVTTDVDFQLEPVPAQSPIVSGTVTEQGSGTPLQGASVSVFDSGGQWRNKDTTDANGDYLMDTNLPEGSARVKCELAGYVTQNKWVTLTGGVTTDVDFQLQAQ